MVQRTDTQRLRTIFMGTPEFAVPTLKMLIDHSRIDIVLTVTQTDKPVGRTKKLTAPPVKLWEQWDDLCM